MAKTFLDAMNRAQQGNGPVISVSDGVITLADTTSTQTLTNKTLTGPILTSPVIIAATGTDNVVPYAADGAISLTSHVALLNKAGVGAYSVAAPGSAGIRITFVNGSDNAHVITFTGTLLADGTTGLNTTATMLAFIGSSLTVVSNTATQWATVASYSMGTIAP